MYLPDSEGLSIQSLSRVFANMSESYKIFWFNGIMDLIRDGKSSATYDEIIDHMIADAWYMVSEYHLNLGPADTLERLVLYTQKISGLKPSAKKEEVLKYLSECDDSAFLQDKKTLTLNVPYRFQAPFIPDFKGDSWKRVANVLKRINNDERLIYHIDEASGLNRKIEISNEWMKYLEINQAIVTGWIEKNLITYLQKRNPSVPGIPNKLHSPSKRNLEKAKAFWKGVIEYEPILNIYASDRSMMTGEDVSIDHFVPWSYVAHDELWNLVPTTKSINSSKSNGLPNWGKFFPLLSEIEYSSYQAIWKSDQIHSLFEKCQKEHVNSNEAHNKLYVPGIKKEEFKNHLEELILPTYNAAKNLGFGEWII